MKKLSLLIISLFMFQNISAQKKIKGMRVKYDEFEQVYFYHQNVIWKNPFELYVVKKENQEPTLRLSIYFFSKNWVFPYKIFIKVNDKIYTLSKGIDYFDDNEYRYVSKGGMTNQTIDIVVNEKIFKILKEIAKNKHQKVKLKFKGKNNSKTMKIPPILIKSLQKMIQVYYILGGKMH